MSLVSTLMQNLRSKYTESFDKNELRESRYGALRFFQDEASNRPILDDESIANIRASFNRDVVVPVLNSESVTVSASYVRTCAIVDSENTSALITLTFTTYGWGFSMTPSLHMENDVSYQKDFTRKMDKYILQFASVLDSACVTQMESDKNLLWDDIAPAYYAQIGDALQVPQTEKNDVFNQVESIMATMDFYGNNHIVGSTSLMPTVRRIQAQGPSNSVNEEFQFELLGGYRFWPTNRISNGAGVEATMYSVNAGSCGIWNRNDPDTKMGQNIGGDVKQWSTESMPVLNLTMGSYYQQDCSDQSAIAGGASAGLTRARTEGFEFSTDIVTLTSYNSDTATQYGPVVKYEILS